MNESPTSLPGRARTEVRLSRREFVRATGVAAAVVKGEEIVFADGVGWADRERDLRVTLQTPFMLASVSKTITCAGFMALVQDGRLDLDADINEPDHPDGEVRTSANHLARWMGAFMNFGEFHWSPSETGRRATKPAAENHRSHSAAPDVKLYGPSHEHAG